MARAGIQVDVTNPKDIRNALDRTRNKIAGTEDAIKKYERDLAGLRKAEARLSILAGEDSGSNDRAALSTVEQVIKALDDIGGPATVEEVANRLDPDVKRKTIGWALWRAAKDEQIQKPGTGVYAPLSYRVQLLVPDDEGTDKK